MTATLPGMEKLRAEAAARRQRNSRQVKAPRFSAVEWERLERQARRLTSQRTQRKVEMPPLEFVRVAAMAVVQVLEELPASNKPPEVWQLIHEAVRLARNPAARNAHGGKEPRRAS